MSEIKVDSGGTVSIGSDSHGATVIEVKRKGKLICVQYDESVPYKEPSGREAQMHIRTESETKIWFSLRQDGVYRGVKKDDSYRFYPGERRTYMDPSF